jgi:hypothetical protein
MTHLNQHQKVHDETNSRIDGERMITSMRQGKTELAFAKEDEMKDRYQCLCIGKDVSFSNAHPA